MNQDNKDGRLGIFESIHRITLSMKDQINTSEVCNIIRSELEVLLSSNLVLFLRYNRDTFNMEILGSSDPEQQIKTLPDLDETSLSWIEKQGEYELSWFPKRDSAPSFLREIGKNLQTKSILTFVGAGAEMKADMILAFVSEVGEVMSEERRRELADFLTGASIVLDYFQMTVDLETMKSDIKSVFDLAPVGIIMVDSAGNVVNANEQTMSLLGCGLPLDGLIGDNLLSGERFEGSGLDSVFKKALEGEETENENLKYKSYSGRVCYLHIKLRPISKPGSKTQAIGVIADVTQRVRLQQQLERSYHTLTEAFQELQRVDKMKTRFIDVVSHELRTPLTVMRGYLELIGSEYKDKMDPKVLQKIQTIKANTDRLYELVESMLDVARIEKGAMEITKQDSSIRALVEGVVAAQKPLALEKHQELNIVTVGEVGSARIDAKKMHDALKNVLNNAIRYTPEGGKIQVGMADEGKMVHIWIKDNGIGIPTADLENFRSILHCRCPGAVPPG